MRRVRHEATVWREQGAGEIKSLLDVGRHRSLLQRATHLLSNRHESVSEDTKTDRIDLGGHATGIHRALVGLFQIDHDACLEDIGDSTGYHNDRLCLVDNNCRAVYSCVLVQLVEEVNRSVDSAVAVEVCLCGVVRCTSHILDISFFQLYQRALLRSDLGSSSRPHTNIVD